ncbi:MAG: hypothetical protein AABX74_02115, partial [Nanoarchaeota archaeon]
NDAIREQALYLLSIANNCFNAFGHNMQIVHEAEMSAISLYLQKKADAFVVDEKTARLLMENPDRLHNIIKHKLHTKVEKNKENLNKFKKITRGIKVIRSVELVTIAYEKGLLDKYLSSMLDSRKTLLESVLWGVKLNGCAVSKREIEQIVKMEL